MKVKDLFDKLKEMELKDFTILVQFMEIISNLSKEDQDVIVKVFELIEKKIKKNYVKKKK